MTVILLVLAAVAAVGDWLSVALRLFRLEFVLKPAALALLLAAAATAGLGDAKPWVLAALALGLTGDIALLGAPNAVPAGATRAGATRTTRSAAARTTRSAAARPDLAFLAGLGAFLLGHVSYLVAFVITGQHALELLAGALVAIGVGGLALPAVLRGARTAGGPGFAGIVAGYGLVLAAATALAAGTGLVLTAVGGTLFLVSDAVLARDRFAARVPYGPLIVIVTYHAAQGLIVLGLVRDYR